MYTETTRIGSKGDLSLINYANQRRNPKAQKNASIFHCLVVDDEQRSRRILTRMVEALGHKAEMARNGSHAFRKFAANGHNLVLTDLDMPYMDGYTLAVRIKKKFSHASIIVMTGRCQAEVSEMMCSDTVDAWLFKPFSIDDLFNVLEALNLHEEKRVG